MAKRTVLINRRPRELETLDKLLALQTTSGEPHARQTMFPEGRASADVARLEGTGWQIVRANDDLRLIARSRLTRPGIALVREIHVTASGRVLLTGERLTVKPRGLDDAEARRIMTEDRLEVLQALPLRGVYAVRSKLAQSTLDIARQLTEGGRYVYAEPVFEEVGGRRWRPGPSNVGYDKQWQWQNLENEVAWDKGRGRGQGKSRTIRIAVIDWGFHLKVATLEGATLHGAYFKFVDKQPSELHTYDQDAASFPYDDHGTACATLAVARDFRESKLGCGAAPEADLIPIACVSGELIEQESLARAVIYAGFPNEEDPNRDGSDGADVIVCSLGPDNGEWFLTSVLAEAFERVAQDSREGRGTPIFWAAGNAELPIDTDEIVTHGAVMAVGRSRADDTPDGSAFGKGLDFLAPGVDVYTSLADGSFAAMSGTSFAAPIAAGVAALLLARDPALSAIEVRDKLRSTCDPTGQWVDDAHGWGRINAEKALA